MKRKICVVTGTRAEYGLLRWLMEAISTDPKLELQLVVTGMHLSPEFGLTWQVIEQDGFTIDRKVEMLLSSDTPVGVGKSMGLGLIGFADAFEQLAPDLLLILGDRFEILAAATAAMVARIPIAHLHGGEATEGLIDEAIRHSITKMSHFHFVAADEYRRRVIQLGEDPGRVFNVGGLGLDSLSRLKLMTREDLETSLGFQFLPRNLLITFHPVTLEENKASSEFAELLAALETLQETGLIFTLPNADTEGRGLIRMVEEFVSRHPNARAYPSLGQLRYLSCMNLVDGVVGNSSSGLIEAPSLRRGTINIGSRQDGRMKAGSVIDCQPLREEIIEALRRLYSDEFHAVLCTVCNPYGEPGASGKIASLLGSVELNGVLKKRFHDLSLACASS
jgi:GDP/UDP-N,N'-diacetylbacillosamine 2-epimerase (hydrolysing)